MGGERFSRRTVLAWEPGHEPVEDLLGRRLCALSCETDAHACVLSRRCGGGATAGCGGGEGEEEMSGGAHGFCGRLGAPDSSCPFPAAPVVSGKDSKQAALLSLSRSLAHCSGRESSRRASGRPKRLDVSLTDQALPCSNVFAAAAAEKHLSVQPCLSQRSGSL